MIDLNRVLTELEKTNPNGFIIESHFQVEFGYALKRVYPQYEVTFEWCQKSKRVDVFATDGKEKVGFEFKYYTKKETRTLNNGLKVQLKEQACADLRRIGFWKDVEKLENIQSSRRIDYGFCLILTNDLNLFKKLDPYKNRDADYDLSDGTKPGNRKLRYISKNGKVNVKHSVDIKNSYVLKHKSFGNSLYLLDLKIM